MAICETCKEKKRDCTCELTRRLAENADAPVVRSELVSRLIKALDYVLEKDDSDEVSLEITFHGANWQTDDEGDEEDASEYPPTLGDTVPLDTMEFSTTEELSGERFDKRDLRELLDLLMAKNH